MPLCRKCNKIFKKTGVGRSVEKLCPKCWFETKRGGFQHKRKKK